MGDVEVKAVDLQEVVRKLSSELVLAGIAMHEIVAAEDTPPAVKVQAAQTLLQMYERLKDDTTFYSFKANRRNGGRNSE